MFCRCSLALTPLLNVRASFRHAHYPPSTIKLSNYEDGRARRLMSSKSKASPQAVPPSHTAVTALIQLLRHHSPKHSPQKIPYQLPCKRSSLPEKKKPNQNIIAFQVERKGKQILKIRLLPSCRGCILRLLQWSIRLNPCNSLLFLFNFDPASRMFCPKIIICFILITVILYAS